MEKYLKDKLFIYKIQNENRQIKFKTKKEHAHVLFVLPQFIHGIQFAQYVFSFIYVYWTF